MREEERAEMAAVGIKPRHAMFGLWRMTPEPWAALDRVGRVLAVWGDAAPVLAVNGYPWVMTSIHIEEHPLFFFREVRRQVAKMLVSRETLICDIGATCEKALRFYRMIGFEISAAENGFHRVTMRAG